MRAGRGQLLAACALAALAQAARAQDHVHPPSPPGELPPPVPGPPLPPPVWPRPAPPPPDALGRDEAREASGTAWQPLATPSWGRHLSLGPAALMLHGSVFLAYTDQGTPRGSTAVFSTSWLMAMARLPLGGGSLAARAMASLEPFTVGDGGYPELLQSGEVYRGQPLHDRQHPHDLFMELAVLGRAPLAEGLAVQVYAAPVGEPALGPVAFPHRASALHDPVAPLAHHWLDSTHISYGVLTGALVLRDVKLEGSWFNGREPDEHRTRFDPVRLDSWSARLAWAPLPQLALQASYGRLASPEGLQPEESVHRVTASLAWSERLGRAGLAAVTVAWGRNVGSGRAEDALLAEGTFDRDGRNAVFGRVEWVVKSARELVVPGVDAGQRYGVLAVGAGAAHTFGPLFGVAPALGIRFSAARIPSPLRSTYGGVIPVGLLVFLQVLPEMAPPGVGHGGMAHGHGM